MVYKTVYGVLSLHFSTEPEKEHASLILSCLNNIISRSTRSYLVRTRYILSTQENIVCAQDNILYAQENILFGQFSSCPEVVKGTTFGQLIILCGQPNILFVQDKILFGQDYNILFARLIILSGQLNILFAQDDILFAQHIILSEQQNDAH